MITTDELFPATTITSLSPRLLWLQKHGILTWYDSGLRHGVQAVPPEWFAGFQHWWPGATGIDFFALETAENGGSRIGEGDSELEALCGLLTCGEAKDKGLKLWTEEATP